MDQILAFATQVFNSQPFSVHLGARLRQASADLVEIELPLTPELTQQHGFAHGGVVSYLADNAITFVGGLSLQSDALTSEFKINYVRPGKGDRLIARASARHTGRQQAVCSCDVLAITDGEEKLCAVAQGTVVRVPAKS